MNVENIPSELKAIPNWFCWNRAPQPDGSFKKPPVSTTTGLPFDASNIDNWMEFEHALKEYYEHKHIVDGIAFAPSDSKFIVLDVDKCLNRDGSFYSTKVQAHVLSFNSYFEISPSGLGIHLYIAVSEIKLWEELQHTRYIDGQKWEFFIEKGYVTVTGHRHPLSPETISISDEAIATFTRLGACIEEKQVYKDISEEEEEIEKGEHEIAFQKHLQDHSRVSRIPGWSKSSLPPPVSPKMRNDDILTIARGSKNGRKFIDLYDNGDWFTKYPSQSEADYALFRIMAFYTQDEEQIFEMFELSPLWRREKNKRSYRISINKAILEQHNKGEFYRASSHNANRLSDITGLRPINKQVDLETLLSERRPTDTYNAERLVANHGPNFRYVNEWGEFIIWNENKGFWECDKAMIHRLAIDSAISMYVDLIDIFDPDERNAWIRHVRYSESLKGITAMIQSARYLPNIGIKATSLDNRPWLLNFSNGTFDLETGEFREHRREDMLTVCLPFPYDTTATCPAWERFLLRIQPDPDTQAFLKRFAGYALTGVVREHVLVVAIGDGSNGKSTFTRVLERLMEPYWIKIKAEVLMLSPAGLKQGATPDVVMLKGKRLATVSEIAQGHRLNESLVKDLTGGDVITARALYQAPITFPQTHKLLMFGNYHPNVRGGDTGIWRRLKIVPFNEHIGPEEIDSTLPDKLAAEVSGIMNWAIEGCRDWQLNGLGEPASVHEATKDYRRESNIIGKFIEEECIVFRRDEPEYEQSRIPSSELYARYTEWCRDNREPVIRSSQFGKSIKSMGYESIPTRANKVAYLGMKFIVSPSQIIQSASPSEH